MNPRSRKSILDAGLALALFLLAGLGWMAYINMKEMLDSSFWVTHTQVVLRHWDELAWVLKDSESGQRGYLITGDRAYLKPFESSRDKTVELISELKELSGDSPLQQARIEDIQKLILSRLDVAEQAVNLRQTEGPEAAFRHVEGGQGKALMDDVIAKISEATRDEGNLLAKRIETNRASIARTREILVAGGFITLGLFVSVFHLLRRELAYRVRAQKELVLNRDKLKVLVEERTAELQDEVEGHKRARAALAASEQRLAGIVGTAMDAIISVDSEQRVVLFNAGAERMFGCSGNEALGSTLERFLPQRFQAIHRQHVQQFGKTGVTARRMGALGTLTAARCNGEEFPIEASISQLSIDDQKFYTVILRDITQRVLSEQALQEAKSQLEKVNQELENRVRERTGKLQDALGELQHFSYTITHDMRAPLRAMRGYADLLMAEHPILDPSAVAYLQRITGAADRMDKLITDALNYGLLVRQVFDLKPIDPALFLRGMIESYPDFQSPKSRVTVNDHMPLVLANEAGLTQCFSNLLNNAIKFVTPGKVPEVRVCAEDKGEIVRLWFEDNGIGVPEAYKEKIFTMFQRLDTSFEGTGIGLALVRKAAERMHGKAGVESKDGEGSRFWLEFKKAPSD